MFRVKMNLHRLSLSHKLLKNSLIYVNKVREIQNKSIQNLLSTEINQNPNEPIRVVGWVKSYRDHKHLKFLHLNDGSVHHDLQLVIIEENFTNKDDNLFNKIYFNTAVEAVGTLVESSHPKQKFELQVSGLNIIGECDAANYPFNGKSKPTLESTRNNIHLRSHTSEFANILRFRSQLTLSIHEFFNEERFVQIHTPVITGNNCEGGCETFQVVTQDEFPESDKTKGKEEFFDNPAYLTASAQLHLETMTSTLAKVYTLSPTFRAEKSRTRHHLAEFYMLEAELIDMNNLDQLMDFTEQLIRDVTLKVYNRCEPDFLASFTPVNNQQKSTTPIYTEVIRNIIQKPFIRIKYSEAIEVLNRLMRGKAGKKLTKKRIEFGEDLNKEQEKILVSHFDNVPVFVTHYPTVLKPFYMRQNIEDSMCVDNFDLLAPYVGEIVGGSLREYRLDVLIEAMQKQKLDLESYKSYLETKKYGAMRMGGFGLGLERFVV